MKKDLLRCLATADSVLMEGALGVRLRREFGLTFDPDVVIGALVDQPRGRKALTALWTEYAGIAREYGLPFLAATPTRRINRERTARYGRDEGLIRRNAELLRGLRDRLPGEMYVGVLTGCRGDGYTGEGSLSFREARSFHRWEAEKAAEAGADYVYAALMPSMEEAAGMADAVGETGLPCLVSFTIRRDGCLVDGNPIDRAIGYIDSAARVPPAGYMANCVHPRLAYEALSRPMNRTDAVRGRFIGLQANAADLPFSELDGSPTLRTSDPEDLAEAMLRIRDLLPMRIFGGCCGTDGRHLRAVARRLAGSD